jgi:hypothetical protein
MRQSDGGLADGSGGRVPEHRAEVLDQEGGDQMREDPGSGQVLIVGGQAIQPQEALQSLEGQLDAPPEPVEFAQLLGADPVAIDCSMREATAAQSCSWMLRIIQSLNHNRHHQGIP